VSVSAGGTGRSAGSIVVNARPYGDALAGGLGSLLGESETVVVCDGASTLPRDAEVLVTLLGDPDAIRALLVPSIRWAHVLGAGVDGFPFDALGERPLTCSRGAAASAIAEWVLAVMLAFEKSLPESWIRAVPDRWNTASLGTLAERTVGLVGIGAIGSEVARRCVAFDAHVVAVRRSSAVPALPGIEMMGDLGELLARSDHVVIAAPATPQTYHLMDAAAFSVVKPGVHLVNVARGSLLDQEALRPALDDGRVARASLDTVDPEPLPEGHWLYTHPSVRLSPHISWSAPGTMPNTLALFVDNVRRFRAGGAPALSGLVDPYARY
jgi:phosphoglycerate dehydrogenase-like enzyme